MLAETLTDKKNTGVHPDRYLSVRKYSETICQPLKTEDYVVQPMPDVSPPKWHLAHTTWFWEEFVLSRHLAGYERFHPKFAYLFNSYYDSVGNRVLRADRGNLSRPTVEEIIRYRHYVDQGMSELLRSAPQELNDIIETGLHHEQQHQELLFTDIKYILWQNPLFPVYDQNFRETFEVSLDHGFIEIPGGTFMIGFQGDGFSFDNEHGLHRVTLEDFSIQRSLATNGGYLDFISDRGYQRSELWLSDGWAWVNENRITAPLYWTAIDGRPQRYSLAGLRDIDPDEPVTHVSFYEASAFAAWKGMRLPTEYEWEAGCDHFRWGQRWEHTNSAYLPYPGYKKPAGAISEYNGKFMVNQMVLRGSSVATPDGHSRKSYRNFFHPSSRWQFNGIRLCK